MKTFWQFIKYMFLFLVGFSIVALTIIAILPDNKEIEEYKISGTYRYHLTDIDQYGYEYITLFDNNTGYIYADYTVHDNNTLYVFHEVSYNLEWNLENDSILYIHIDDINYDSEYKIKKDTLIKDDYFYYVKTDTVIVFEEEYNMFNLIHN